jgi:hypothetical protein
MHNIKVALGIPNTLLEWRTQGTCDNFGGKSFWKTSTRNTKKEISEQN